MKKTPWFPPDIKPVHVGVYEVNDGFQPWFRYWSGRYWYAGGYTPDRALSEFKLRHQRWFYADRWRGVAK